MGAYVNPKTMSKEEWLSRNGTAVGDNDLVPPFKFFEVADSLPVVLVDNGAFTAAAIGFCEREYEYFTDGNDKRPKTIYTVLKDKLYDVSAELETYLPRPKKETWLEKIKKGLIHYGR